MNTTFLLITLSVVLATIGFIVLLIRADYASAWDFVGVIGTVVSGAASLILVGSSFGGNLGVPIQTDTANFATEITPYRVIVKAFDHEVTFTDAYAVAMVTQGRLDRVRLTTQRNAWGITHDSQPFPQRISLLFKPNVEKP